MVWGRGSGAGDPGKRLGARELGEPGWAGSLPQRHSRRGGSGCRATCRCLSSHFGAVLLDWAAGPLGKPPTYPNVHCSTIYNSQDMEATHALSAAKKNNIKYSILVAA